MNNFKIRNRCCLASNEPMRVYHNTHNRSWSVQQRDNIGRWKVVAYADSLTLKACKLRVSEAGRQRSLKEGRKNVHAYVQGYWVPDSEAIKTAWHVTSDCRTYFVAYNPKLFGYFTVAGTGTPVMESPLVQLANDTKLLRAWIY